MVAIAVGIVSGSGYVEAARLAARYTARASFVIFVTVFLASTAYRLTAANWARWMTRERRGLGLAFAAAHFVHLGALAAFFAISGEQPPLMTLVGGGLGYVGIVALVSTSTDTAMRRLGGRWTLLHRTVIWYVWAIFLFSYARRALTWPEFILPTAILIAAALAKLAVPRLIPRS